MAAWFLLVALLYLVVALIVPRVQPDPVWGAALIASLYVVIGLGTAWYVSNRLTRRIRDLAAASSVISRGDLTRRIDTAGDDETAELARSFSAMLESLLNVVFSVSTTAEKIQESARALSQASEEMHASSEDIAETAREIAHGAEEQASQVARTAEITGNLSLSVERVANRAGKVSDAATSATRRATAGAEDARNASASIGELAERTASVALAVEGFRRKAGRIGKIVTSISSISHQTHLLAINAAIEAVRAGEHGKGFAVVAEEVSLLADNVRDFAEQISGISEEITLGSGEVFEGIRDSLRSAEEVRRMVERTAVSFDGLLGAVRGTAEQAGRITDLAAEQRIAAEDVARALETISQIAARNAAGTEQASASSQDQKASMQEMARSTRRLAGTADHLRDLISIFRTL
jgi:methyl-accepting chemotaxis protein